MALFKGDKHNDPDEYDAGRRELRTSLIKGDDMELDENFQDGRAYEYGGYTEALFESVEIPTKNPDAPPPLPGLMDEMTEGVEPAAPRKSPEEIENEAREKANRIITEAQTEAARLVEENKHKCEKTLEEARQEGYEAGFEEGDKTGRESFTTLMEEASILFNNIKEERQRVLSTVEPEVAKLAVEIAEQVIGREVKTEPDIVLGMVKEALGKVKDREEITIRVHPDDVSRVEEAEESFIRFMQGIREHKITGDPRVEQGGCIIESDLGSVDSRLKIRIEAIKVAFDNTAREYADGNIAESNS